MFGFDWTRTKACTRRAMAESDWGSRISSQGMDAASAMPVVISIRRSASCSRTANQMACVFMVGGQDLVVQLLAPLAASTASICSICTSWTASARCR